MLRRIPRPTAPAFYATANSILTEYNIATTNSDAPRKATALAKLFTLPALRLRVGNRNVAHGPMSDATTAESRPAPVENQDYDAVPAHEAFDDIIFPPPLATPEPNPIDDENDQSPAEADTDHDSDHDEISGATFPPLLAVPPPTRPRHVAHHVLPPIHSKFFIENNLSVGTSMNTRSRTRAVSDVQNSVDPSATTYIPNKHILGLIRSGEFAKAVSNSQQQPPADLSDPDVKPTIEKGRICIHCGVERQRLAINCFRALFVIRGFQRQPKTDAGNRRRRMGFHHAFPLRHTGGWIRPPPVNGVYPVT